MSIGSVLAWPVAFLLVGSCHDSLEEHRLYITRGDLQIGVRTREYDSSGLVNIDACVMARGSTTIPELNDGNQCFFHGYDIQELNVRWNLDDDVTITSRCGHVYFKNWASVVFGSGIDNFHSIHANFIDRCTSTHYQFVDVDATTAAPLHPKGKGPK